MDFLRVFYRKYLDLYDIFTEVNLFQKSPLIKGLLTLLSVTLVTLLALGLNTLGVADASIVLTLLMAVVLCSWAFGLPYSLLSSVLAILVHSFFFSVPIYSFEVYDPQHLMAFGFMVAVGVVVGNLSVRLRDQVTRLAVREERLKALHRLGHALADKIDRTEVVQTAESFLSEILGLRVNLVPASPPPPSGTKAFLLKGSRQTLGWLTLGSDSNPGVWSSDRKLWVETLLASVALALERVDLIQEQQEKIRDLEATLTRNTILHSISHDLRTPLTVLSATATSVLERTVGDDPRRADLESMAQESQAIVTQVENLLELTSLTSGALVPRLEWVPLEDLVYPCLEALALRFSDVHPQASLPPSPNLCKVDETLVNKALTNLLENAALYAPGPVEVRVRQVSQRVRFEVADRGPGISEADRTKIFQQFVRGGSSRNTYGHRGSGLGLALVQSVAALHGGSAGVDPRPGGGSVFWFDLPQSEPVPELWGGAS